MFFVNLHNFILQKIMNLSNGLVACKQTLNYEMLSYNLYVFIHVNLLKISKENCNLIYFVIIYNIIKKNNFFRRYKNCFYYSLTSSFLKCRIFHFLYLYLSSL